MYRNKPHTTALIMLLCLAVALSLAACSTADEPGADGPTIPDAESVDPGMGTTEPISSAGGGDVIAAIQGAISAREFATDPVAADDIETILLSGSRAPSARNSQPWHFTVVTGARITDLVSSATEGNVVIVISGPDNPGEGIDVSFDCGSASQNMYLTAQALGYGAHIYTGPVSGVNNTLKADLGIPDGYSAVAILNIGNYVNYADAVAAATTREPLDTMVNYVQ